MRLQSDLLGKLIPRTRVGDQVNRSDIDCQRSPLLDVLVAPVPDVLDCGFQCPQRPRTVESRLRPRRLVRHFFTPRAFVLVEGARQVCCRRGRISLFLEEKGKPQSVRINVLDSAQQRTRSYATSNVSVLPSQAVNSKAQGISCDTATLLRYNNRRCGHDHIESAWTMQYVSIAEGSNEATGIARDLRGTSTTSGRKGNGVQQSVGMRTTKLP